LIALAAFVVLVAGYVALILIAGAPQSPLVPVLPAGVHPAGWITSGADGLGLAGLTRTELTVVALLVLVVVVAAFLLALREAWAGRVPWWLFVGAGVIVLGMVVAAPPLLSRDVYSYAAYGRILTVHGSNPYLQPPAAFPGDPFVAVASPEWVSARSVYGPAFTLASAGLARTWSGSVWGTILAFKALAGISVAAAAALAALAARQLRPGREAAAAVVVVLNPVIVLHTVGGGHNDALVAACLAAAFVLAITATKGEKIREGPALLATVMLTLAVLVKAIVAPLLILWIWQIWRGRPDRGRSRPAGMLAKHVVAALIVAVAAFVPVQAGWDTIRALLSVSSRQGWASGPGLAARGAREVGRALGGSATGAAFDVLVSLAFGLLFVAVFWRVLRRARGSPDADQWGGTMLLLALASPYLLPWYAAWFVPFVGLLRNRVLLGAALIASCLLALTGVPAEPAGTPQVWQDMLLGVHYAAAPLMLALLGAVAWSLAREGPLVPSSM
jgi:hypothetical protein